MAKGVNVHSSNKISGKASFTEKSNVQKSSSQGPRAGRAGTVSPTADGANKKGSASILNPLLQAAGIIPDQPQTQQQTQFSDEANKPEQRRSNNEYQKQKEKTRFLDEAQNGREAAEKKAQGKPESNGKDQHADNYQSYLNEADRLTVEKTNSEGLTMEEQDEYDRRIKEAKDKAEEERKAAGIKNAKEKWDDLRSTPLLSDDEQEAWAFLQPDEQTENIVGGWGRQYAAGPAMAAGTALQWFDQTSDDMVRYEYDQEHGEGAYDAAIAGKNVNQIGQLGNKLWDTGTGLQESGQQMWEAGTADMSNLGREVANFAKTGTDVAADAALNSVLPGMGTMRMYLGAAGGSAYEQSQRENNDIDSRAVAALKGGLSAYLSNKLVGGMDAVYGKSALGKYIQGGLDGLSPDVQKVLKPLMNTEGVEEALEDIMNYAADQILGLDTGKPIDWNEVMQDYAIGYALGVLTNGLAGGINIDDKKRQNIGKEMVEFGERAVNEGLDIDQAAEEGKRNTRDQVVLKYEPEKDSTGTAWTGDWNSWVNAALSGGALSDTDVDTIYNRPAARQAFEEATGISLDGMTEEEAKSTIGMAAGTQTTATAAEPTSETNANEMPSGEEPNSETNDTTGEIPNPEQANTNENAGQNETAGEQQNPNGNQAQTNSDTSTTGSGEEKVSEFYSNTVMKEEGPERVPDPLTYLTKPDAEMLTNAMNRLKLNGQAETDLMMASTMWSDEQFKMAKGIRAALRAEADKTGNRNAYDAWLKIEREHATAVARALRAVGQRSGSLENSEEIRNMADRYFQMIEEGLVDTVGQLDPQTIADTKQTMEEVTTEIGKLEADEKAAVDSGLSAEEAFAKVKDRYLDLAQKLVAQRNVGFLSDNILGRNRALRKGAENVNTNLRKTLAKQDADYIKRFVRANDAGIVTDLKYQGKPTAAGTAKWVSSMQKMCQLFGTGTTLRNLEGNTAFGSLDFLSNNVAGVATDQLLSLLTGNSTRGIEGGIFRGKNWKAAKTAAERSMLEVAANMDMSEDGKYIGTGTSAFNPYNMGSRFLNRANQILSYALNTTDAGFVGLSQESAGSAAQRANARRGGNMTDETAQRIGRQEAEYRTYKNDTLVQTKLEDFRNVLDLVGWGGKLTRNAKGKVNGREGGFGLGTAIVPYIGVPVNIALKGAEYSPLGAAKGIWDAGKAVKAASKAEAGSQAQQDALVLQNKASGEIGRGITGTALVWLLSGLMKQAKEDDKEWFHNWNLETNSDVKAQNKAEGKSGMQINIDRFNKLIHGEEFSGKWKNDEDTVNIAALEPLDQYLGLASLLADDDDALDVWGYLEVLASTTGDSLKDLPAISSLTQIADTINYNTVYDTKIEEDEEGNPVETREVDFWKTAGSAMASMAGNAASGFIPAPVRHIAQVSDEYQRETKGDNAAETAWNQILNSIPGARQTLDVKTDNYGNKVTQGDIGTRVANTYLANKYTEVNQSDVSREFERLRDETDKVFTPPRTGPSSITFGSGKNKKTVYLDASERKETGTDYGKDVEKSMQDLMQNPAYQASDSDTQAAMVKAMESFAKDTMKQDIAEDKGIEFESKYDYAREMKDPVDFLATQAGIAQARRDDNLDAVDMILASVRNSDLSQKDLEAYGKHIQGFSKLNYLTENGMRTERAQTFDTELKELYEGEKRTAARGSDYFRTACSGRYNPEEADAIMSYETAITQETEDNYKDRIKFNLDQANLGNLQGTVWGWIEECADGNMTTSQFNKNLSKAGIPAKQQYELKQIRESMTEDKHMVGKTVSGIYRAMREVGYIPEQALQFYEMCDPNYNGSYTKKEFDSAVRKAFGSSSYGKQVRSLIRQYVGK